MKRVREESEGLLVGRGSEADGAQAIIASSVSSTCGCANVVDCWLERLPEQALMERCVQYRWWWAAEAVKCWLESLLEQALT